MTHKPSRLDDPSRCPGCGTAVPRQHQLQDMTQPEYVCQGCRRWQLDPGFDSTHMLGTRSRVRYYCAYPPLWSSRDPADPAPAAPVLVGGYYLGTPPAAAPGTPGGPAVPPRDCRLRVVDSGILLDGKPVELGMTPDRRKVAECFVGHLIRSGDDWISGPGIDRAEDKKGTERLSGQRWDRLYAELPWALQPLIEPRPGKGYRLRPTAWRK
jgi:hypothetical protein